MSDVMQAISSLPASAARMLAVEILLADPEALADDVLESALYMLRDRLRAVVDLPSGQGPTIKGSADS